MSHDNRLASLAVAMVDGSPWLQRRRSPGCSIRLLRDGQRKWYLFARHESTFFFSSLLKNMPLLESTIRYLSYSTAPRALQPSLACLLCRLLPADQGRQSLDPLRRVSLNGINEILTSGHILDQPDANASGPDTSVDVSVLVHSLPPGPGNKGLDILELAPGPLLLDDLDSDFVLEDACCILHRTEDVDGVELRRLDNVILDVLVDGRFSRAKESGPHVGTCSAQCQRGSDTVAVGNTAAGDEGDRQLLVGASHEDQSADVLFSRANDLKSQG